VKKVTGVSDVTNYPAVVVDPIGQLTVVNMA